MSCLSWLVLSSYKLSVVHYFGRVIHSFPPWKIMLRWISFQYLFWNFLIEATIIILCNVPHLWLSSNCWDVCRVRWGGRVKLGELQCIIAPQVAASVHKSPRPVKKVEPSGRAIREEILQKGLPGRVIGNSWSLRLQESIYSLIRLKG